MPTVTRLIHMAGSPQIAHLPRPWCSSRAMDFFKLRPWCLLTRGVSHGPPKNGARALLGRLAFANVTRGLLR